MENEERRDLAKTVKKTAKIPRSATVVEACRLIRDELGYSRFRGVMVDSFTASAIVAVYDGLNDANKEKFAALNDIKKMAKVAFSLIK